MTTDPFAFSFFSKSAQLEAAKKAQIYAHNIVYTPPQISPSFLKTVPSILDLPFDFVPSARILFSAVKRSDLPEASRAVAKLAEAVTKVFHYPFMAIQNFALAVQFVPEGLAKLLPTIRPDLAVFLVGSTVGAVLASLGEVAAIFGIIYTSVELSTQREVDSHLQGKDLEKILEGLNSMPFDKLFDSLPDYLKLEIEEKSQAQGNKTEEFFKGLGNDTKGKGYASAAEMVDKIREASERPRVTEIISADDLLIRRHIDLCLQEKDLEKVLVGLSYVPFDQFFKVLPRDLQLEIEKRSKAQKKPFKEFFKALPDKLKLEIEKKSKAQGKTPKEFFKNLPRNLQLEIEKSSKAQGRTPEEFFKSLGKNIRGAGYRRATEVIDKIRKASDRQQVVHMISIVACAFAIIALIAVHVACPHLILISLSIAATGLGITAFLMKKGWVENPGNRFSFTAGLPAFLRRAKEEVEIEFDEWTEIGLNYQESSESEEDI